MLDGSSYSKQFTDEPATTQNLSLKKRN